MSGPVRNKRRQLTRDVKHLMYGYGDVHNPADDSAEILEDYLVMYLNELCEKVMHTTNGRKARVNDFVYALRHDPKKLVRVHELLAVDKELSQARSAMDLEGADKKKSELLEKEAAQKTGLALPNSGPPGLGGVFNFAGAESANDA
ncbi:Transcription initiation factor TFIID subunit 13 [Irineochytrium annulatum]|nr:Transcription initiation factor TFIID subunit 13 [Irineochytrium annulatum]